MKFFGFNKNKKTERMATPKNNTPRDAEEAKQVLDNLVFSGFADLNSSNPTFSHKREKSSASLYDDGDEQSKQYTKSSTARGSKPKAS